jgi:glucose/arabinose dehydrogenase
VYYSVKIGGKLHQRLSRFRIKTGSPNTGDPASEQPLWTQADPASNHNGGDLQFGPDGYLYVSVGDGGAGDDQFNNARFINKGFFAAILRMDVNRKAGNLEPNAHPGVARNPKGEAFYSVPADNPFIGTSTHHGEKIDPKTVRTEIWATGLRNPWRISFDEPTGRLFAGDIGQNLFEELDIIVRGGDYGWSYREALHPFTNGPGRDKVPAEFKPVDPILEWPRTVGISITGGFVYRGERLPELKGSYVCADYGTGIVQALSERQGRWEPKTLSLPRAPGIAGIGKDPRNGDVLMANLAEGSVKRLSAAK